MTAKLLDFQQKHSDILIESLLKNNIGISAADTGTGKTYIAIYIAKTLNLKPFIICPKSVIYNWINVIKKFEIEYYGIANYELIKNLTFYEPTTDKLGLLGQKQKLKYINKDLKFDLPDDCLLIFDEAHKCKNKKTINSKLLLNINIKEINYKLLLLSATLADTIENFAVFATLLKLVPDIDLYGLCMRKYFNNNLILVNKEIYPKFGGRIKIKEIKDIPDNIILPDKYYMDNAEEIQKQYELIQLLVEDTEEKIQNSNCILEQMIRARQQIEALKVPTIVDLIKTHLDNNLSVVVFVNFINTIALINSEIKIECKICGDQSLEERNKAIEDFQSNKKRFIVATMQSGGVGISLHDTDGDYPRVSIISPSWSAQDLMQSLGRIYRAGLKSKAIQKIVYCADTIEELIAEKIQSKLNNYASLNDGKEKSKIIL